MTRADACVNHLHTHVGICQRAGYANGRADALEEVAAQPAPDRAAAVAEALADRVRAKAVARADEVGHMDARGAAIWDVASWLTEDAEATATIAAALASTPAPDETAAVERVRALLDEWASDKGRAWVANLADELRAALTPADTPGAAIGSGGEVGTGASGGGDPAPTEATLRVNRSVDCPEAPAQAHLPADSHPH